MADILETLRDRKAIVEAAMAHVGPALSDAADEIERLRALTTSLRVEMTANDRGARTKAFDRLRVALVNALPLHEQDGRVDDLASAILGLVEAVISYPEQ